MALVQLSRSRIAITGATGFLGGYLVADLLARSASVVAVVRDAHKAARVLGPDVEVRVAELGDGAALTRCFAGCDAVVSNAAMISFRKPQLTMQTNVEGTRNVFEAIARAGVGRAIAISSASAYPAGFGRRALDEQTPLRRLARTWFGNAYGVSKAEAERVARTIAEAHGIALTTFRPCGITGPHDPLLITCIDRAMRVPVVPFPACTEIGVVHAADVAVAVALALEHPDVSAGKAYNLQGHTVTLWQIADAWRRAGGRAARLRLPVPVPLALRYDDSRVRQELGWQPRALATILDEAVRARRQPEARPYSS